MNKIIVFLFFAILAIILLFILRSMYKEVLDMKSGKIEKEYFKFPLFILILYLVCTFIPIINIFVCIFSIIGILILKYFDDYKSDNFWMKNI